MRPTDLSSLVGWHDMTQETFNDGDAITTLTDRSPGVGGTPRDLTQATAAKKPTAKTGANGINGRPAASFDGGDEMFGVSTFTALTAFSVFTVCRTGADVTSNHAIFADGSDSLPQVLVTGGLWRMTTGTGLNAAAGSAVVNNNYVIAAVFNGASSILRVNGIQVTGNTGAASCARWLLGSTGNTSFWNNLWGETIVYNAVRTTDEIVFMEKYLNLKWGFNPQSAVLL